MEYFIKKHKYDIISLFVITLVFLIISYFYGYNGVNLIIDSGREAYYPELMLKGKILYKDLFNIFGPFSYQVNAFLYQLFGINISTLLNFGRICGFIITCTAYFIIRYFFDYKLSLTLTIFFICSCVFSISLFNFVYPYSYAMLYAYLSFLLSVLCFLYALRYESKVDVLLFLSYFFIGISIASKIEYFLFVFVLFFYSIFVFKQNFKKLIINTFLLILIPVISYGVLFLQGLTYNDCVKALKSFIVHSASAGNQYFYKHRVGTFFSADLFQDISSIDIVLFITFLFVITTTFFFINIEHKYIKKELLVFLETLFFVRLFLSIEYVFMFIPYFLYGYFAYLIIKKIKTNSLDLKKDVIFIFSIITIISILKTGFCIKLSLYGAYTILFPLICFIWMCCNEIPKFFNKVKRNDIESLVIIILAFFIIITLKTSYYKLQLFDCIETVKGKACSDYNRVCVINKVISYMEKNIPKDKYVLVIPKGVMINYLTDYDMKLYNYHSLLPSYVDTFGIDKIIKDIKSNKIDYIILNNSDLKEYGGTVLDCDNYRFNVDILDEEKQLCEFINTNYDKQVSYRESSQQFNIYKLK